MITEVPGIRYSFMEELLIKYLPTATAEGRKGRWQLFGESFPIRMAVIDEQLSAPSFIKRCFAFVRIMRGFSLLDSEL